MNTHTHTHTHVHGNSQSLLLSLFQSDVPQIKRNIFKLSKKAHNLSVHVMFNTTHQSNSHKLLQQLHWLPIEYNYGINFKMANITFNTLYYSQPAYLHSLLCFHTPVHSLRSSNTNLLTVLFTCTTLGAHSFSVASPKI